MQQVIALAGNEPIYLDLPDPAVQVVKNVAWGRFEEALTPAFWAAQAWMDRSYHGGNFALGRSLKEELVACLLGGHGAPAEVGLAAFDRIIGHLETSKAPINYETALDLLSQPLMVKGRGVRYRFAATRARYLVSSLDELPMIDEDRLGDVELRDRLCQLPGVGAKTASWIVRNRRGSDDVAILDVHIMRAGIRMGVFDKRADPARRYFELERQFLDFCRGIKVRPSVLDAVMWRTMRAISPSLMDVLLNSSNPRSNPSKHLEGEDDVRRGRWRQV